MKKDLSISMSAATVYILLMLIPLMVLLMIPFNAIWGMNTFFVGLEKFMDWPSFLPVILIGVPAHELIHGLSWVWFGKIPFRDIKFGLKALTPYAHCKVPMRARAYRFGAVMPAFLLGILPYVVGLVTGSGWFTSFGLVYILAAGGDLLVLWTLRSVSGEVWVEDHPSRAGCYIMEDTDR
jgi:hypothetical protein